MFSLYGIKLMHELLLIKSILFIVIFKVNNLYYQKIFHN